MNADAPHPRGTRDEILAILLGAAALAAGATAIGVAVGRRQARGRPGAIDAPVVAKHAAFAPIPLKKIAEEAGVQPPTALAHLGKLQEEGKVGRIETPDGPRYTVQPYFRCEWIDPDHGVRTEWKAVDAVDWRFPLVSRVPDAPARGFLLEWLDRAQARGILPAHRSRFEEAASPPPLLQVVVYGSCARGDAHPKSDLDILLYGPLPKRTADALVDLGHEVALRGGRAPDVRALDAKAWEASTEAFRDAVARDGKTVFLNHAPDALLEQHVRSAHG